MVVEQSPGLAICSGVFQKTLQRANEMLPVLIVSHNRPAFDSAGNDMLEQAGNIDS